VIVADASVVVEMLLGPGSPAAGVLARHFRDQQVVCAPHLLDAEVGQALRRLVLGREMSFARAQASLDDLADLPIRRFSHTALLSRAFALRANVTVYDGIYLALAEALGAPLISCDAALRNVPGCTATVEAIPADLSKK
jgi:predicted nucleic acid-binding protein